MTPQKSVLSKEQMKNQRKITDLFAKPSEKRKLEKPAVELSPKRLRVEEEPTIMAHTPQKFKPSLRSIVQQKTKVEVLSPEIKEGITLKSKLDFKQSCDVIDLSSDDEDGKVKPKLINNNETRIEAIISNITKENIPEDAVVGSIINTAMIKQEGMFQRKHFFNFFY